MNTQVKEMLLQSLQAEIGDLRRASANGIREAEARSQDLAPHRLFAWDSMRPALDTPNDKNWQ